MAFQRINALSSRAIDPGSASCSFSRDRDGFVLGEGAAAVVLEDVVTAKRRDVRPLVRVCGWGSVSSAYHMTRIRTDQPGDQRPHLPQLRSMQQSLLMLDPFLEELVDGVGGPNPLRAMVVDEGEA